MISGEVIDNLEYCIKEVDDVIISAPNVEQLTPRVRVFFERCRKHGITLSPTKVQYGPEVKFVRFLIKEDKCYPDPTKIEALINIKPPTNTTSLKSLLDALTQTSQ